MSSPREQSGNSVQISDRKALPNMIAWLSVCLLAVGWGSLADPFLRNLCILFAVLGLAAAVGLDARNRRRRDQRRRRQRRIVRRRLECELSRMASGDVKLTEIRNLLQRLASQDLQAQGPAPNSEKRSEHRLSFHRPIRISPVTRQGADWIEDPDRERAGWLRDISPGGVGMRHKFSVPKGPVKLTLELAKGERVSLITEVTWCRRQSNGAYYSGGRLVQVFTPAETSTPVPAEVGAGG